MGKEIEIKEKFISATQDLIIERVNRAEITFEVIHKYGEKLNRTKYRIALPMAKRREDQILEMLLLSLEIQERLSIDNNYILLNSIQQRIIDIYKKKEG